MAILRIDEVQIILIGKLIIISYLALRLGSVFKVIVLPFLRRIAQHLHLAFRVVDGSVELLTIVRLHHFACVLRWLVASATISTGAHWL